MTPYPQHEISKIIKPMAPEQREALKQSIQENGQHEPIDLFQDKVLEGNTRQSICLEIGKEPKYKQFEGTEKQALAYVMDKNIHRRHMSLSVRACYAALYHVQNTMSYEERGQLSKAARWGGKKKQEKANRDYGQRTIDLSSRKFGISGASGAKAVAIKNNAKDLFDRVLNGGMELEEAYRAHRARLPKSNRIVIREETVANFKKSECITVPDASAPPYEVHNFIDEMIGSGWRMEMKVLPYVGSDMTVRAKYFVNWYGNGLISTGTAWNNVPSETEFRRAVVNSAKKVLTKTKQLIAA